MAFFEVDKNRCTKDNICVNVCVAGIIKMDAETGFPAVDDKRSKRCIACGHCVAYCPHDACSVATLVKKDFIDINRALVPSVESADTLLRSRRTIRLYRKEELPRESLQELVDMASNAPTGKNIQDLRWSIITKRETMREISDKMCELYAGAEKTDDKQRNMLKMAMVKAYRAGKDPFLNDAPNMAIVLTPKGHDWPEEGTISMTYMEIAAHARGIGTCWAGYFVLLARESAELRKIAGIPEDMYISGALLLGKPVYRASKKSPPRKKRHIEWV